jgi:uncharacterized protein YqgC (DUF456 family)
MAVEPSWWVQVLQWLGATVYVVALVLGVIAAFLGLPGNPWVWLCGFVYSAAHGWDRPALWLMLVLIPVVVLAELIDNLLSMTGVRKFGGSSRTMWWAVLGGLAGALVFSLLSGLTGIVGLVGGPVGFVIGALLPPLAGGLLGGYLAGYWYERRQGAEQAAARRAGWGALLGRLAGGAAKGGFAVAVTVVLLIFSF